MRPIIRWGLWERRWTALSWTIGISLYIALNVLVYGSIRNQAQALNKALNGLPKSATALFGASDTGFLSPIGYINSKVYYLILPLLFTMLVITLSSSLLAREEQSGTIELLLSRPISRNKLLLAKLMVGLIIVVGVGTIALLVTVMCAQAIHYDISLVRLAAATLVSIIMSVLFGSIAWLLLGIGRLGKRASVGTAAFIALGSYLIDSLQGFASWLQTPAKLLPYHYYQSEAVLKGTYNWWNAAGLAVAAAILFSLAFVGFRGRDLD